MFCAFLSRVVSLWASSRMHLEHMFEFTLSQPKIRNTAGLEYHFGEGL